MASSTFAPAVFSVLATPLRAEFGVARWQIGALVTVVTAVGSLLSPVSGTIGDRLAPRHSTAATLAIAGVGFLAMSGSPGYVWLAGAAVFGGIAQAMANPATNRLIMTQAEQGRRGLLTGVKQAGVQAGNFLGGLVLPLGALSSLGWRGTVALAASVPAIGLGILAMLVRGRPVPAVPRTVKRGPSPPVVMRLAVYAALLGLAAGSMFTYLPSYASEAFSLSTEAGGALVSVFAGVGFLTRLAAGTLSERFFGHHRTLVAMAALTALSAAVMALAPSGGWLWPAAILMGLGPMAWNVVANLAVMELSPEGGAGRGSGVMMAGFLGGMAVGAPLMGGSVDLLGTYRPGWAVVVMLGTSAAWVGRKVREEAVLAG